MRADPLRFPIGTEVLRSPAASLRKFSGFLGTHVASGLQAIYKIPPAQDRGAVCCLYLKLIFKLILSPLIPAKRVSEEKVLGSAMQILHYGTFLSLVSEIFIQRIYYFETSSRSPLIVDAGSNIGMSILFFTRLYPQCRVIGFEPDPQTFNVLRSNIQRNHLEQVQLHNKALCAANGEVEFYTDLDRPGSGRMSAVRERFPESAGRVVGRQKVEAARLSGFILEEVDLLKLDIEGAEGAVMQELAEAGKLKFIKQIIVEYHHHLNPCQDYLSRILRPLEENGFGYQISGSARMPIVHGSVQPILIYAYRKS
ncbi:MAG: FkbM family methyltransferase [Candidatus Acidiferrales bacterium]